MKNLVVLISGSGRNLQALIEHCAAGHIPARIAAVVSNKAEAYGLERAHRAGIATEVVPHGAYPSREAFDAALAAAIDRHAPDLLAMAGFMRILTPGFTRHYLGRALNIHPSLLPRHPGLRTHAAALAAGDAEHGASVHFVTEALDGGPLVLQGAFTVAPEDSAESLAERVMNEVELKIYPQAVAWLARGDLQLRAGQPWLQGAPLLTPRTLADLEEPFR
ncbi:MAG: phosphoribosylglycinamide formyltransferase [Nevskiaceae bacterium]|nr:MAG: phosphoribosylglycinamide formyltransferase [Nevskiaceae bacterium]TAM29807.1 MAG: phosphoribosylglycinamide formyltransferase [Nevskiaceae bacterium]